MSDGMNLKELMELAKMKETRPREYEKVLAGIMAVSVDMMKIAMKAAEEMQDG